MRIQLMFLLVIVLSGSCARKTYDKTDYSYYRREISKLNTLEESQREKKKDNQRQSGDSKLNTKDASLKAGNRKLKGSYYLTPAEKEAFARLLQVPTDSIINDKLYASIKDWLGTPYQWGGTTQNGVDCSSLTQQIYQEVYGRELPRTSIQQFYLDTRAQFQSQKYLREGDLIFFRLRHQDKIVSHVGIYLQNGKFLGSNSPRGVEITDLDTHYWQDKYVASARLLSP
ncbi:MAG TPA: C40 family peptidase [Pricia sp.]|nr:C40 family peptidase [Pricia sp.]